MGHSSQDSAAHCSKRFLPRPPAGTELFQGAEPENRIEGTGRDYTGAEKAD